MKLNRRVFLGATAIPVLGSLSSTARSAEDLNVLNNLTEVECVIQMKTMNLLEGQMIKTRNYYEDRDGGGGIYEIVSPNQFSGTPDEQGDHILENKNIAVLKFSSRMIDAEQYGVVAGVSGDDCTPALQAAINAGTLLKTVVQLSAGNFFINNKISIKIGTNLQGVKLDQYPNGYGVNPKSTQIIFEPARSMSLFVVEGEEHGGFRFHQSISGIYIRGNVNSVNALQLNGTIYGNFTNISIVDFDVPIYCTSTINNRFENIYVSGNVSAVEYEGSNETTDVWTQCTFFKSPIGVNFKGSSIGVRFDHCLLEQLDKYGIQIAKECQTICINHCYAEDVPFTTHHDGAVFRVGHTGQSSVNENSIEIVGGKYSGKNTGNTGSFIDFDESSGGIIANLNVSRFEQVIKASDNTSNNSILVNGIQGFNWTNGFQIGAANKIMGMYPLNPLTSANYTQEIRTGKMSVDTLTAAHGNTINIPTIGVALGSTGGTVYPSVDNSVNLGAGNVRWKQIYSASSTISSSDARVKENGRPLNESEIAVALKLKSLIKMYKFSDAVKKKGESARWHVGAYAQEIEAAFTEEGLNGFDYGILCYDEWEQELDNEGHVLREAGNLYSVRYEEMLAFIIAIL